MLSHKLSVTGFKKPEVMQSIFPITMGEVRNQKLKENWKIHKPMKIEQIVCIQPMGQTRVTRKTRKYLG